MLYLLAPGQNRLLLAHVGVVERLQDVRRLRKEHVLVFGDQLLDSSEQVALGLLVAQSEAKEQLPVVLDLLLGHNVLVEEHVGQKERRLLLQIETFGLVGENLEKISYYLHIIYYLHRLKSAQEPL